MRNYLDILNQTPGQMRPEPGLVQNNAGGYVYALSCWDRLTRFLILGTDGPTYYATAEKHTIQAVDAVYKCIVKDGPRTVGVIEAVSFTGRAPKNDAAILALAMCALHGDDKTKAAVRLSLARVCRIGTHILQFVDAVNSLHNGSIPKSALRSIASWYTGKSADDLAYQMMKYKSRGPWSQRDVIRQTHPKHATAAGQGVLGWAAQTKKPHETHPRLAIVDSLAGKDAGAVAAMVRDHNLPREVVPTELLNAPEVWAALFERMPLTAMVRNLGKMSTLPDFIAPREAEVCRRLRDVEGLRRARIHPIALLMARMTYASGHGMRGSLAWSPSGPIVAALDDAFYLAFQSVAPTGKRICLALDVSGSMGTGDVAGIPGFTPRLASAALAMVTLRTEETVECIAFTSAPGVGNRIGGQWGGATGISPLPLTKSDDLITAQRKAAALPMGGTDCALPMLWAMNESKEFDAFVVFTDNETWAGNVKPAEALRAYRKRVPEAKLIVVGMTATGFSIADPNDAGMLDVVGFDAAAPSIMADFIRGSGAPTSESEE